MASQGRNEGFHVLDECVCEAILLWDTPAAGPAKQRKKSTTGEPTAFVWVIRRDPQDETSLFAMPVGDREMGVFLFTQRENADEFARTCHDMPASAVVAPIWALDLARVLTEQGKRGLTHVVTDPILGSPKFLDEHTLTISDYLKRLGG